MDFVVRLGAEEDADALGLLYDELNDTLAASVNYPGWIKGVYPIRQDAVDGIREGCLFAAVENGEIVGSIILRHTPEPAYWKMKWQAALDYENVLVVNTFVVDPKKHGRGVGRRILEFAEQYAKDRNVRALRLDVYERNVPAIRLYEKCGYQYTDTVSLGLEQYGLDWFKLYEKLL